MSSVPPAGANRLLELAGGQSPVPFAAHQARYGPLPLSSYSGPRGPALLAETVERAHLSGRGGAGFPLAAKLRAVAATPRRPAYVVANGAEGEPASRKDRLLLSRVPHLVLDGAVLAADCVGASEVHLCVHRGALAPTVAAAVRERRDPVTVAVHEVPDGYVSSQETSLLNFLAGRRALPSTIPPLPAQRGLRGRPTLVSNVETLAHLALLARYGPRWFAEVGTAEAPGTFLATLAGAVREQGVREVPFGTPLTELLAAAGAVDLQAVLLGGYFGTWLSAGAARNLRLAPDALRLVGANLGAAVVLALPQGICGLGETLQIAEWLSGQRARQCGPCINGLPAIVDTLAALVSGRGGQRALRRLSELAGLVNGRGACRHPDGVVRLVGSALRAFEDDVAAHAAGAPCRALERSA